MAEDSCSACHAPVRRLITEGGKVRELNPKPVDGGNHQIITRADGSIRARVLTGTSEPAPPGEVFTMHRCPPSPPPGPPCGGCQLPMDRALALLERWTFHPCCDPDYRRDAGLLAAARTRRKAPR